MSVHIDIEFCKKIAYLFYAIAASDKRIEKIEYDVFKSKMQSIDYHFAILGLKNDIDMYLHITSTFNALYLDNCKAQPCFDEFIAYKKTNEQRFPPPVKQLIMKIASQIASSFSDQNKSELMMLAKLSIEFKK